MHKLIAIFDAPVGDAAYDTLNTLRVLRCKLVDERRRHGDHTTAYRRLIGDFEEMAAHDFVWLLLDAAVIWEGDEAEAADTADERYHSYVNELEGRNMGLTLRVERLQALWRAWQDAQGYAAGSKQDTAFLDAYARCCECDDFGAATPTDGGAA